MWRYRVGTDTTVNGLFRPRVLSARGTGGGVDYLENDFETRFRVENVKKTRTRPPNKGHHTRAQSANRSLIKTTWQTLNRHLPLFDNAANPRGDSGCSLYFLVNLWKKKTNKKQVQKTLTLGIMVKRYLAKLNPSKFIGRRWDARRRPAPHGTTAFANRPVRIARVLTVLIDAYVIGIIDILRMVFDSKRRRRQTYLK